MLRVGDECQRLPDWRHELLVAGTKSASAKQFFESTGTDPWTTTPDELAKFQAGEAQKWGRVIKAAGIEPE